MVTSLLSVDEIPKYDDSNESWRGVTFLWYCLLYKVVLTFESAVDEILKCEYSSMLRTESNIPSPEAAILLVKTKTRDLWPDPIF